MPDSLVVTPDCLAVTPDSLAVTPDSLAVTPEAMAASASSAPPRVRVVFVAWGAERDYWLEGPTVSLKGMHSYVIVFSANMISQFLMTQRKLLIKHA